MLDILWRFRGSVALDSLVSDEAALAFVDALLEEQQKPITERRSRQLAFDDPIWRNPFGRGSLAMGFHDRGSFCIEHGPGIRLLRYELRSLHALLFCLAASLFCVAVGWLGSDLAMGVKLASLAFAWLYGGSQIHFIVQCTKNP